MTRGIAPKVLRTVAVVAALAAVAAGQARAAILGPAPDARFANGSVHLTSSTGNAMFPGDQLVPGQAVTACYVVRSDGTIPAQVRMYARVEGPRLARRLLVTVTRGTMPSAGGTACAGFAPEVRLYRGTLDRFPSTFRDGLVDPGR
jgi:hypothetical protein